MPWARARTHASGQLNLAVRERFDLCFTALEAGTHLEPLSHR
jgi:hypothetical protein